MAPRSQSGNVTLLLMLGMFALGLAGGLYYIFGHSSADETNRAARDARAAYDEAVASLERALKDPRSVETSLDHNAGFECFYSGDGNCKGKGGTFLLFEAGKPNHPLSYLASDAGADVFGSPCRGFPSKDCPLRVETVWEPMCAGDRCESTKSMTVKAKVTLAAMNPGETPLQWAKDVLFTPQIQLSQASQCARGGGEWSGTECLTPSQVAERRIASPSRAESVPPPPAENADPRDAPTPAAPPVYECPNQIVVQSQYYPVQFLAADRGQVTVPSMSCPDSGLQDTFVFQCTQKTPAAFPNEGQWVQVEAAMAACAGTGAPVSNTLPTRF
ncbi:MAG: hypothetical protein ACXVB9_15980 [Bdellovibrionota bacterium]